jgi:hypothetical protein
MAPIIHDGGSCKRRVLARCVDCNSTWADIDTEFDERAAICEFDGFMPRHEAEAQALADTCDAILNSGRTYSGILGELITAARRRHAPALEQVLQRLGIAAARAPLWGFGHIVHEGEGYSPADRGGFGDAAFIVAAFEHGGLVDLVAETIVPCSRYTRCGSAAVVNFDAIDMARHTGQPLLVFERVRQWLRGGCHGAVVIDWRRAAHELDGVRAIHCPASLAPTAYRWTRRCWPRPTIAVPSARGSRGAA